MDIGVDFMEKSRKGRRYLFWEKIVFFKCFLIKLSPPPLTSIESLSNKVTLVEKPEQDNL